MALPPGENLEKHYAELLREKPSPAPWHRSAGTVVLAANGQRVCDCERFCDMGKIAAAPDMFDALDLLRIDQISEGDSIVVTASWLRLARAAINKAKKGE